MFLEENAKRIEQRHGYKVVLSFVESCNHWCGYVVFPKRFLREPDCHGFVTYAPVHGGITFSEEREDGSMVYGFDCGHAGADDKPELRDEEWLLAECDRMAVALKAAVPFERQHMESEWPESGTLPKDLNDKRAEIIQAYHDALKKEGCEFVLQDNFGAMINVLGGSL